MRDDVLKYGELADLVHEYNTTVVDNRLEYNDYRSKDHDEAKNAYQDIADRLYDSSDKITDSVNEDQPGYVGITMGVISTRLQAEQNQELADSQNGDGRVKKLEYDGQETVLIKDAQTKMISYWQKAKARPVLEKGMNQARSKYEAMVVEADQGMATQVELLGIWEKMETAQAALETNDREGDGLRRELCIMMGRDHNAQPDIREVPAPNAGEVDQIDLESDKERAIEQNFTQIVNERRPIFTGNGTQWDVMNQKVKIGCRQIEAGVEVGYKLLEQVRADYEQAAGELELVCTGAQTAGCKCSLDMISKGEYTQQQGIMTSSQSACDTTGLKYRQILRDYR